MLALYSFPLNHTVLMALSENSPPINRPLEHPNEFENCRSESWEHESQVGLYVSEDEENARWRRDCRSDESSLRPLE